MEIKDLKIKLPKEKKSIGKFYGNCEKRKKFVAIDKENHKKHLKKAKHDLYRAEREYEDKCWDWTVIKAYYSIHHTANSLLLRKKGFFCKDHSCLIISLKYHNLINDDFFKELSDLHESLSDILGLDLTFQLRKLGQYDVNEWENITEKEAALIISIAKKLISFVENA
ncbi:MAG: HEPN domain-containing protein [Nanoarchaeota archaeon]|mgnify:CR=1 FL=1